ncbi:unnamed protein product [Dimorphilus gyrociliatus]|uniref:RRM domain-containing protein n=1 Tax=Dimorphilus gyrociliatus TaxID=2664684 RepID=A0A7I8VTQ9_9ANNE|nr:unnamed protein product [Dimorphilus gyrociliatus]
MSNSAAPHSILSIDQITKVYYDELTQLARKNRRMSNSHLKKRTTLLFNKNLSTVNISGMFSQKVFVGGAPPGISDTEILNAFGKYGNFTIEKKKANEKSSFFYVIYESNQCVKGLLTTCVINSVGEFYTRIGTHIVQVIPWEINNSHYVPATNMTLLDNKKVVFIGGLHGKMTAKFIAEVFSYFGPIVMVTIDVDKYKYPIGSGRVAFSDSQGKLLILYLPYQELRIK